MQVVVAPLIHSDREQWQNLYHGYAEFYKMPMKKQTLETVWGWIFDPENPFYCLLAKNSDGSAVGLMHFRAMPSPLRGSTVGFLDDLFVTPEARGLGVVEVLYKELDAAAKENDWPFVRWITAENNYRGRAVYDKISEKTHWVTYQLPTA